MSGVDAFWNPDSASVQIICTSSTRPTAPAEGQQIYETDTKAVLTYSGTAWVQVTPRSTTVAATETTTSAAYVDLTTVGPAVTITTGAVALITISALLSNADAGKSVLMSCAVSGATTATASDDNALTLVSYTAAVGGRYSYTTFLAGLTAGSNTFTCKYRVGGSGGTGSFTQRRIIGVGLLT